jgi:hypothetical protein
MLARGESATTSGSADAAAGGGDIGGLFASCAYAIEAAGERARRRAHDRLDLKDIAWRFPKRRDAPRIACGSAGLGERL